MHESLPPTELPAPEITPGKVPEHGHDVDVVTERSGAQAVERPLSSGTPPAASHVTASIASPASLPGSQPSGTTSHSAPAIADDNDLIEKEWVQKAKAIVEKTKENPYQQNKDMSHYRADYIKKRFNKDVKVSDS